MPSFQKESFLKSFLLFFIVIEIFLLFIFYGYTKLEEHHLKLNIFLEMKNYSYDFSNSKFDMDIEENSSQKLYELQENKDFLFIYTEIKDGTDELLKITYPIKYFQKEIEDINQKLFIEFLLLSFVALIISLLFTIYSLYPLQKSYTILQEFMKDIIHDINTPISSIKLNLTLIEKQDDELKAIAQSVNTLEMLHKNLDNYLNNTTLTVQECEIEDILMQQIIFFQDLYDWLKWDISITNQTIMTDRYIFSRVIYNIIHNACKYNRSDGFIKIEYENSSLKITNSSYGVKNPRKVFNRFYKESDRGLGIGLHIVSKLLNDLEYKYSFEVFGNDDVCFWILVKF